MVIGPYAKQGYVSSVQYDHTSALKHVSNTHGLEPLTMRQAAANDLTDCIDVDRIARNQPAAPITLPAVEIDDSTLPDYCHADIDIMRVRGQRSRGLPRWARDPRFWRFHQPRPARDDLYDLAAYLDKHDLGRIRRR
jgi:phospholipase C